MADFVFVPARQMVPEKLRALYVTGGRRQSCVREFGSQTKLLRYDLRRVFKRRATSSAFSLLLNAEMRK